MNNILSIVWHIIAIISMSFLTSCASNNVELPKASIRADKTQIVAPSMSSDFTVSLKANCNWGIIKKDNDAADWLTVTPETGMGNADIVLSLTANKSGTRETISDTKHTRKTIRIWFILDHIRSESTFFQSDSRGIRIYNHRRQDNQRHCQYCISGRKPSWRGIRNTRFERIRLRYNGPYKRTVLV